jgi:hypothetical protein
MVVPTPGEPDTETWRPGLYLGTTPLRYSAHAGLRCVDCHPGADRLPHPRKLAPVTCNGACHTQARVAYDRSAHAEAMAEGAPDAPTCADCHGTHGILPAGQREAPTHPLNAIRVCGDCHKTHTVPLENGMDGRQHVQSYLDSVHGKGISAGGLVFDQRRRAGVRGHVLRLPWVSRRAARQRSAGLHAPRRDSHHVRALPPRGRGDVSDEHPWDPAGRGRRSRAGLHRLPHGPPDHPRVDAGRPGRHRGRVRRLPRRPRDEPGPADVVLQELPLQLPRQGDLAGRDPGRPVQRLPRRPRHPARRRRALAAPRRQPHRHLC